MTIIPLLGAWQRFESEQSKSRRANQRWLQAQAAVPTRRRSR